MYLKNGKILIKTIITFFIIKILNKKIYNLVQKFTPSSEN